MGWRVLREAPVVGRGACVRLHKQPDHSLLAWEAAQEQGKKKSSAFFLSFMHGNLCYRRIKRFAHGLVAGQEAFLGSEPRSAPAFERVKQVDTTSKGMPCAGRNCKAHWPGTS